MTTTAYAVADNNGRTLLWTIRASEDAAMAECENRYGRNAIGMNGMRVVRVTLEEDRA